MEETFIVWQPVFVISGEGRGMLSCFLTQATVTLAPADSKALAERVVRRLNLKGQIARWEVKQCLTSYATPPEDLGSEATRWRRAWTLDIEIEKPSATKIVLKHESLPLQDGEISVGRETHPETELPYLLVADFPGEEQRATFLQAVEVIVPDQVVEMMATFSGENLTVFQARIRVGARNRASLSKLEHACEEYGGFTNFARRLEEAEEVYNPNGVE